MPRKAKSKKLKQLEQKLKIIQKEILKRNKKKLHQSHTASSKRKRLKSTYQECRALLDKINRVAYSKPFAHPVDWEKLSIPTYPKIIKHPMDLSTVSTKLENSEYHSPYQFAGNFIISMRNCVYFINF